MGLVKLTGSEIRTRPAGKRLQGAGGGRRRSSLAEPVPGPLSSPHERAAGGRFRSPPVHPPGGAAVLIARLNTALRRAPRWKGAAGSPVFMAVVGWIDVETGPFVEMSIFYLPPIAAIAWYVGRREGLWSGALATALWALAGPALGGDDVLRPGPLVWNRSEEHTSE